MWGMSRTFTTAGFVIKRQPINGRSCSYKAKTFLDVRIWHILCCIVNNFSKPIASARVAP
jgi:hypothetical protein